MRHFFIVFLLAGCASNEALFDLDYQWKDEPRERYLLLTFNNNFDKTVCLLPEMWPNDQGKIDAADGSIYLEIEGNRYFLPNFNLGYCPGCVQEVKPSATVTARLNYSDFNIPFEVESRAKHLVFRPKAYLCD